MGRSVPCILGILSGAAATPFPVRTLPGSCSGAAVWGGTSGTCTVHVSRCSTDPDAAVASSVSVGHLPLYAGEGIRTNGIPKTGDPDPDSIDAVHLPGAGGRVSAHAGTGGLRGKGQSQSQSSGGGCTDDSSWRAAHCFWGWARAEFAGPGGIGAVDEAMVQGLLNFIVENQNKYYKHIY